MEQSAREVGCDSEVQFVVEKETPLVTVMDSMSKTQFTKAMLEPPPRKKVKLFDWKTQLNSVSGDCRWIRPGRLYDNWQELFDM
jgi:hypothetical protein